MERMIAWGGGLWGGIALSALQILVFLGVLLLSIAYLLYLDRKVLAAVMLRKGPNVVGPFGLLQSFADFGKFIIKEIVIPAGADKPVFILAPLIGTVLAMIAWAAIPVAPGWVIADLDIGVLYLFAVSSLGIYGIIMGGWASNSKYPFLGALRSAAQMISYEVSMGLSVIAALLLAGTLNLSEVVEAQAGGFWNWHVLSLDRWPVTPVMMVMFIIFFVSALAETNRSPFDLPEAESELVAGYQSEYSSTPFLLYYLGEQVAIVTMCALSTLIFFGGWHGLFPVPVEVPDWLEPLIGFAIFGTKIVFFFFLFALVRALVPRYRYDQLMRLGWKVFLPLSFVGVILVASHVVFVGPAGSGPG